MLGKSVCNFCCFSVEGSKMCLVETEEEEKERDSAIPGFVH